MLQLTVNNNSTFSVAQEDGQTTINGQPSGIDISMQPNGLVSILYGGKSYTGIVEHTDRKTKEVSLRVNGKNFKISIQEPIDQLLSNMGMDAKALQKAEPVKAPMPGMVLKILVVPGQHINKGDGLLVLEAMKMENVLKASAAATVKAIKVKERTPVEKGTVLIELE